MKNIQDRYNDLYKQYLDVGGDLFDAADIDQAAISYSYNTCGIEGNTITLGETESIVMNDQVIPGKSFQEHLEIKDAHRAFTKMFDFIEGKYEMNEELAMTFHKLNTKSWMKEEWSGSYKTINNRVGGRSTPYPEKAKDLFKQLFRELKEIDDPFLRAVKLHLDTVIIHPWQDGNGRTARLLMNYELISNGHGHLQLRKADKEEYFHAIRTAIKDKKPDPFSDYLYHLGIETYRNKITFLTEKKMLKERGQDDLWKYNDEVEIY